MGSIDAAGTGMIGKTATQGEMRGGDAVGPLGAKISYLAGSETSALIRQRPSILPPNYW